MDIPEITKIIDAAAGIPKTQLGEKDRLDCLAACHRLQGALETPLEACQRFLFGLLEGTGLRLGIQMKIFEETASSRDPFTVDELAVSISADRQLVGRIVRLLAAMKLYDVLGHDRYVATPLAAGFVGSSPMSLMVQQVGPAMPVVAWLPEYFEEKGYADPSDGFKGPWQYTYQTPDHYFEWLAKRPELQRVFSAVMGHGRMSRDTKWFEFYPVEEKLRAQSPFDTALVDVGGGLGHELISFRNRFPDFEGRLVLEDQAHVVASIRDLPPGIQTIGHNFFEPQPSSLRGAKAYYLRTVLHDWPDSQATTILKNIRELMTKDSVLLIHESAMPVENASPKSAFYDFMMMAYFSALDRTEQQFTELLSGAGFSLVQVWRPKDAAPDSPILFEAVVKN
ncbi:S-adenosyl-L-methionine-dependent methyltransferase [Lophiostoma macrostomum CBS 122681]|uniref:S-adenosyl-L-methionine-dependent methyltransferase n=1 Tax=Lophiostoma macrostomum CBS 122681 TaxID=1314788 RepID=A0A6A6SWX7_9PLEO|nr:S-adenosyl-L-methionine-dependent methyltransferase [Lophiostoma macrostomum CBS 122681]